MNERTARIVPVVVVLLALLAVWYLAATLTDRPELRARPLVPAPHRVLAALAAGLAEPPGSARSLLYHAAVTASTAAAGFALALVVGIAIALGIVHVRALDRSVMPWVVASQTVPVLAVAPMVVVVLGNVGLTGLLPKALIAAWLSFFPVVTAMVTGLRCAERIELDLLRTYSAGVWTVFAKLRWPASMPFLFAGIKVAAPLAIVGAMVAELPTGAQAGLGARLLAGSYYGQTLQIWAALCMAGLLALLALGIVDTARVAVLRRRGGRW
jgi:NitT/TauT family transport system permease protein